MASVPRHNLGWLLLSALVIGADQCSKAWIARSIPLYGRQPLIAHFNLIHAQNTGVAFSMLNKMPPAGFIALSAAVAVGIAVWLWRHPSGERLLAASLALILGGAVGNAIDRFRFGYVVDFIDFYVGNWHFATFNIADSAISVGAGLLILDMFIEQRRAAERPH